MLYNWKPGYFYLNIQKQPDLLGIDGAVHLNRALICEKEDLGAKNLKGYKN